MEFFTTMTGVLYYQQPTLPVLLFVFSVFLLVVGVAVQSWDRTVRLGFLEHKPLNWIENTHPHLPSSRIIITIALCTVTLLLAGLQTMKGTFPFNDPYHGLNLASLFLIAGSMGIVAELKWKGAGDYACAFLTGTSLAFLLLILQFSAATTSLGAKAIPIALLLPSVLLAGRSINRDNRRGVLLTVLFAFSFWIFIYISQ